MKYIYIIAFLSITVFACKNSRTSEQKENTTVEPTVPFKTVDEIDAETIKKYVADKKLPGDYTKGGIYVSIQDSGKGPNPSPNSDVVVEYQGYLLNGTKFDGTEPNKTANFNLNQLIPGWKIGIPLLRKGGKATFVIPSSLAYGAQGSGDRIPANSVLTFDIKLVDFK